MLAWLLLPLSWLYGAVVRTRRGLYRAGWLSTGHPGVPVVIVGNITVGGTGKTPVVAWLAGQLRARGLRPGIISRGYAGHGSAAPVRVLASGNASQVGDEPLLLARRTGLPVVVCRGRLKAARALLEEGVNIIIADDGLQHYALKRDLEIAVVDGTRHFGNLRLLPAGPLREPLSRLASVDLVMVNGGEGAPGWLNFSLRAGMAINLCSRERRSLEAFAGQKVWVVAGIGHPERFHGELERRGMEVVPIAVPDHARVELKQLRADAAWPILMTEKDAVKYPACSDENVWFVPVDMDIPDDSAAIVLDRVLALVR